jgi:hypothetical protein
LTWYIDKYNIHNKVKANTSLAAWNRSAAKDITIPNKHSRSSPVSVIILLKWDYLSICHRWLMIYKWNLSKLNLTGTRTDRFNTQGFPTFIIGTLFKIHFNRFTIDRFHCILNIPVYSLIYFFLFDRCRVMNIRS